MKKPIMKIAQRTDLPPIALSFTADQHAALDLALRHAIMTIDSKNYEQLEDATVKGFAKLRTLLYSVQATLRDAHTAETELPNFKQDDPDIRRHNFLTVAPTENVALYFALAYTLDALATIPRATYSPEQHAAHDHLNENLANLIPRVRFKQLPKRAPFTT